MLEKLSKTLQKATDKIANAVFLNKDLVNSIVKDLQRALIEADVNVSLVLQISQKIKKQALDERIKELDKKEHLIKLLHDELLKILGTGKTLVLGKKEIFLFLGLYGAGKTTTIGKIASFYAKRGKKVCAIGLDVHRPAASEQLKQVCEKINITSFIDPSEKNPLNIWKKFQSNLKNYDLILVDTAGRDALDKALVEEIKKITNLIKPTEKFLIIQADIGQTAKNQAKMFNETIGLDGIIITKMDSSGKGGGALTACHEAGVPIVFIGTGEKTNDLETFDPESFLSRLLGMGDLKSLMEKIHSLMSEKELQRQQEKFLEGKFTLKDFQSQLDAMKGLGGMDKLFGMVPGLGKMKDKISKNDLENQEEKINRWKNCINSMTEYEINNPEVFEKQSSRIQRVAKGSGCSTSDVRALLRQYKLLKSFIKDQSKLSSGNLDQKTMMKLAKKFGKKIKF